MASMARPPLRPIVDVAAELGIGPEHVIPWGPDRAKIDPAALDWQRVAGVRAVAA